MLIKNVMIHFLQKLYFLVPIPLKKSICFESQPDFSDNTRYVFEELILRGYNKKYKMYWILNKPLNNSFVNKTENVEFIERKSLKGIYAVACSKVLISCNSIFQKHSSRQKYIHLMHGSCIKDCSNHYQYPDNIDVVTDLSPYTIENDAKGFAFPKEKFVDIGFPRNDDLFKKRDISKLFGTFDKYVYWLPTYRQHNNVYAVHSDISMPILYNKKIAEKVNSFAREKNTLIIVKPHPSQDVSKLTEYKLSNLIFIDDAFLMSNRISNYELLGNCSALLTDYSSVYFDYLLCNKPIGLCWDDYKSYEENEGFAIDMKTAMAGGEKLYSCDDLCSFIMRLANSEDVLVKQRTQLLHLVHTHRDNHSTRRVVDYIEKKLF